MKKAQASNLLKVAGQCGSLQTSTEHHLTIVWKLQHYNYTSSPHIIIFHFTLTVLLDFFFKFPLKQPPTDLLLSLIAAT